MYYACDWKFRSDVDLDLIAYTVQRIRCNIRILNRDISDAKDKVIKVAVEIPSETDLRELIRAVGQLYNAEVWYPIVGDDFLSGVKVNFNRDDASNVFDCYEKLKTYTYESDEFYRKLSHEWDSYSVFASDWPIDKEGLQNIDRLFDVVASFGSQLMSTRNKNSDGLEIIRFITALPSEEVLTDLIEEVAKLLPLKNWFRVSKADLPNVLSGNPKNFVSNGYTVWREGLLEAARFNKIKTTK